MTPSPAAAFAASVLGAVAFVAAACGGPPPRPMKLYTHVSADPERLEIGVSGRGNLRWALLDRPASIADGTPPAPDHPAKDRVATGDGIAIEDKQHVFDVSIPFRTGPKPQFVNVSSRAESVAGGSSGLLVGASRGGLVLRAFGGLSDEIDLPDGRTACAAYWIWGAASDSLAVLSSEDGWPVVHVKGAKVPLSEYPHPAWTLLVWREPAK